jgi:hypothetical protein
VLAVRRQAALEAGETTGEVDVLLRAEVHGVRR